MRTAVLIGLILLSAAYAADGLPMPALPASPPLDVPAPHPKSMAAPISPPAVKSRAPEWPVSLPTVEVLGLIDLFGSVEVFRAALSATRIEAVRLKPRSQLSSAPADYAEAEPIALSPVDVEKVRRTLVTDSSYQWDVEETCECLPRFEFRVRFLTSARPVTCDVSLTYGTVRVVDGSREVAAAPLSPSAKTALTLLEGTRPND